MYDLYMGKENQAYSQYQDSLDRWNQEMSRLTSDYNTLYDREYGEYLDQRNMAYNEYTANKDMAWDEYLRELEKEQAAAELMAGTGNYDRLKDVYGLSDEEIAAIKEANEPKYRGPSGPTYEGMTEEEKQQLIKLLSAAGSEEELAVLAQIYAGNRNPYDINSIVEYVNQYILEKPEETEPPTLPKRNPSGRADEFYIYSATR